MWVICLHILCASSRLRKETTYASKEGIHIRSVLLPEMQKKQMHLYTTRINLNFKGKNKLVSTVRGESLLATLVHP